MRCVIKGLHCIYNTAETINTRPIIFFLVICDLEVIILVSCSTQMYKKCQSLIKNKTVKINDIVLVLQSFFCSIITQVNNAAFLQVHMYRYVSLYLYPIGVNSNQNAPYALL